MAFASDWLLLSQCDFIIVPSSTNADKTGWVTVIIDETTCVCTCPAQGLGQSKCQLNFCHTESLSPAMKMSPPHRVMRVLTVVCVLTLQEKVFSGASHVTVEISREISFLSSHKEVDGQWRFTVGGLVVRAKAMSVHVRQGCYITQSNWNSLEWTSRTPNYQMWAPLLQFICKRKPMIHKGWLWR